MFYHCLSNRTNMNEINFKHLSLEEIQQNELDLIQQEEEGETLFNLREEYAFFGDEFYN